MRPARQPLSIGIPSNVRRTVPRRGLRWEHATRSASQTCDVLELFSFGIPSNVRRPRPRRDSALGACDVPGLAEVWHWRPFSRALHSAFPEVRHQGHAMHSAFADVQLRHPFDIRCTRPSQWFCVGKMRCPGPSQRFGIGKVRCALAFAEVQLRNPVEHAMRSAVAEVQPRQTFERAMPSAFAAVVADVLLRHPFEHAMHPGVAAVPRWEHAMHSAFAELQLQTCDVSGLHRGSGSAPFDMRCTPPSQRFSQSFSFGVLSNVRCIRPLQLFHIGYMRRNRPMQRHSSGIPSNMQCTRPSQRFAVGKCIALGLHGGSLQHPFEYAAPSAPQRFGIGNMRCARSPQRFSMGTCEALGLAEVLLWGRARHSAWQRFSFGNVRGTRPGRGSALGRAGRSGSALGTCEALGLEEARRCEHAMQSAFAEGQLQYPFERAAPLAPQGFGIGNMRCAPAFTEVQLWESARRSAWQRFSSGNVRGTRPGRGSALGRRKTLGFDIGNMRGTRPGRGSALGTCEALSQAWQRFSLGTCEALGPAKVQLWERARRSSSALGTCEAHGLAEVQPWGRARRSTWQRFCSALGTCEALGLTGVQLWESARRSAWQTFSFGNARGARPGRG